MTATLLRTTAEIAMPLTFEATSAAMTATRATTFLRAQCQWLQRGLAHSSDPVAVAVVLGAHDRSHERWVSVIQAVRETMGDEPADEMSLLYLSMGRIAESLSRRATELLCPNVAAEVRDLLGERLCDRTEAVVEHVWQAAAWA